jgi:hypothetical protein
VLLWLQAMDAEDSSAEVKEAVSVCRNVVQYTDTLFSELHLVMGCSWCGLPFRASSKLFIMLHIVSAAIRGWQLFFFRNMLLRISLPIRVCL